MSTVFVRDKFGSREYNFHGEVNLLAFLREQGISLQATCGGLGLCGKCEVLLRMGTTEKKVLACHTTIHESCEIILPGDEADLSWNKAATDTVVAAGRVGLGAAVDLGTTTVALQLYDLSTGADLGCISQWNMQKSYGADVITRIGYCADNAGGLAELQNGIQTQVFTSLKDLCAQNGRALGEVKEIFLAGNTVMQHIFAGLSPVSIASAPFAPGSYFERDETVSLQGIPVHLSPCVAGYVGGDITAGILAVGLQNRRGKTLFIDVGTNGEMVLGDAGGFVACAVASGPAFEGAGITCGMPAANGAVHRVYRVGDQLAYEVLGGGEPKGLCGSGLLDLMACLLELGLVDASGRLAKSENGAYYLTDRVYLTQKDIRQLQLAKAAIAAGIKLLLAEEKLSLADVDSLCLAGGFGNRLNPASAVQIGMLPAELSGKIKTVGNACLAGAEAALLNPVRRAELLNIKNQCRYIELSVSAAFNQQFLEEINFPGKEL